MRRRTTRRAVTTFTVLVSLVAGVFAWSAPATAADPVADAASSDARVQYDPEAGTWTMTTDKVQRILTLSDGRFSQTSLLNRSTGREYQQSGATSDFRVRIDGTDYRGSTGGWNLDGQSATVQDNGAIHLVIRLSTPEIGVTRNYWVYPGTSFIEERTDVTNKTDAETSLTEFAAISMRVLGDEAGQVDLYSMNGDKSSGTFHALREARPMGAGQQNFGGAGANGSQPFLALRHRDASEGLIATWDYTGEWATTVGDSYGKILIEPRATLATSLPQETTITGPVGRIGFFEGDLDAVGNSILDFTYRYLWDETSEEYVPLIRYGGYGSDPRTILDKTRQLTYIGGDMVWMDDGWQDAMGDWNATPGEPLGEYRDFAARSGIQMGYWLVPWGAEGHSDLAQQHPEWMLDPTNRKAGLDTVNPDVRAHIDQMLQQKQQDIGPFMLKTDFGAVGGNLQKANATMSILEDFVAHNPDAGLQLCSDGGGLLNLRTVALSDLALLRDGRGGKEEGYWSSLLYPAEKLIMSYGRGDIGSYTKSNRHLLSFHLTIAGDTTAGPDALEPLRIDAEIYRYLASQDVMGRWVKVYRPTAEDANGAVSAEGALQKMSGDAERGYITFPKDAFAVGQAVTLFPKGLEADRTYTVATQEGSVPTTTKVGAEWMDSGIEIAEYAEGEVIYFNLEDRPGSGTDTTAPSAPSEVVVSPAAHMGAEGVDVTWRPGADDRRISYYEVFKNGEAHSKVSVGEFFFDPGATSDDEYSIRTVDGDGNASAIVGQDGSGAAPGADPGEDSGTDPGTNPGTDPQPVLSAAVEADEVRAGQRQTVTATGFAPGEIVTAQMDSDLELGSRAADADGMVSFTWTVPADAVVGAHTVSLDGVESGAVSAMFRVVDERLATTGGTIGPWLPIGAVLLVLGAIVAVAPRRRGMLD